MKTDQPISKVLPSFVLTASALDELELLAGGLYAPANGYCLPDQVPNDWPAPFLLQTSETLALLALEHGELTITDTDGTPVFRVHVTATSGAGGGMANVAGLVSILHPTEHPPARNLRITSPLIHHPDKTLVATFSSSPSLPDLAKVVAEVTKFSKDLVLIAVCGPQPHGNYTVMPLLDQLRAVAAQIPDATVGLLVLPTPDSEAATAKYQQALHNLSPAGIWDFSSSKDAHTAAIPSLSGKFENPIASALCGTVIFLTGLSGSGKSTVARALVEALQTHSNRPITLLDGDDVRRILSPGLGFSPEEREANIRRLGWVASLIAQAGGIVVCAPIAPYEKTRQEVRDMIEAVGRFVLVHISTPLDVCESRDRKGLYARARRGELKNFTGVDAPYEVPLNACLKLDTNLMTVEVAVERIVQCLESSADPSEGPLPGQGS